MKFLKFLGVLFKFIVVLFFIQCVGIIFAYGYIMNTPHSFPKDTTLGIMDYDLVKDTYTREEIQYESEGHTLQGYFYDSTGSNILLVTVHGYADKSDYLLPVQMHYIDKGYDVFSFDLSGCGNSESKFDGFSQSLIDLDYTMTFLNTNPRFKDYKKLLFGFSAGGYAVCSILAKTQENIIGVASVSSYNDAKNLVFEKGLEYVGALAYFGKPVVEAMEWLRFRDYLNITAKSAIDGSTTPVFLAHGLSDTLITYDTLSTARFYENGSRVTKYTEDATHSGILFSEAARSYKEKVDSDIKKLKGKEKMDYISKVDDAKYTEINSVLFNQITAFYETCIENA